jgi:hypothetical protein
MGFEVKIFITFLLAGFIIPIIGIIFVDNCRLQKITWCAALVWFFVAISGIIFFIWSL